MKGVSSRNRSRRYTWSSDALPSGKAEKTDPKLTMKKSLILMAAIFLFSASCDRSHIQQAQVPVTVPAADSELDREIRRVMEKGINLEERKRQVPAIAAVFERYTEPGRARKLAALCYLKTLGTTFMPMDIAEIALAETGGHGLKSKSVSNKGALGVWQVMPARARTHGYSAQDLNDDEKCAEAAVRELYCKLIMADGNLVKAKKLYCGWGVEANAYEARRRQYRKEILEEMTKLAKQGDGRQQVATAL